jgi:hypothetical protein
VQPLQRHFATFLVLLCLQAMATVMSLRRDPLERFEAAAVSALVWTSLEAHRRGLRGAGAVRAAR